MPGLQPTGTLRDPSASALPFEHEPFVNWRWPGLKEESIGLTNRVTGPTLDLILWL
jgi:hypothetical protein